MTTTTQPLSFFSPENHLNENGTALYVESFMLGKRDELPDKITAHIEECDFCKEQVLGLFELMKEQPINPVVVHPYFGKRSVIIPFPSYLKVAAVFLIVILGTGVFYLVRNDETNERTHPIQSQSPVIALMDSTSNSDSAVNNAHLYADHFAVSPNLDDLVNSNFRSVAIEVLSPDIDAIVTSPITFQWKQYRHPILLKILNNKDLTLLTSSVQNNKFITSKALPPGLYYWKLEDNGELLYVGKFFVK